MTIGGNPANIPWTIGVSKTNKAIYVGSKNGKIFASFDNGDHWQNGNQIFSNQMTLSGFGIDEENPQRVFAFRLLIDQRPAFIGRRDQADAVYFSTDGSEIGTGTLIYP